MPQRWGDGLSVHEHLSSLTPCTAPGLHKTTAALLHAQQPRSPNSVLPPPPKCGQNWETPLPLQGLLVLPTGLLLPHGCISPALCAACWLSPAVQGCSAASLSRESWGKVSAAIQRWGRCGRAARGSRSTQPPRPGLRARRAGGRAGGKASGGVPAAITLGMLLIPLCPRVITTETADPLLRRARGPATISGIQLGH